MALARKNLVFYVVFGNNSPDLVREKPPKVENQSGRTSKKLRIRQLSRDRGPCTQKPRILRGFWQQQPRFSSGEATKSRESVREDHQKPQNSTTVTRIVALARKNLVFYVVFGNNSPDLVREEPQKAREALEWGGPRDQAPGLIKSAILRKEFVTQNAHAKIQEILP